MTAIAIAHDQLTTRGGAETVAFELARTFDAPIYASTIDPDVIPADVEAVGLFDDGLSGRCLESHYLLADLYQMLAWQHVEDLYEYDVIIQNKNNPGWFVPKDTQTVVKYCHSPPRGPYDQFHRRGAGLLPRVVKLPMRALYRQNTSYVDAWVCNSDLVQRRIERYWDVPRSNIRVVYPPVPTDQFGADQGDTAAYYFTFSRLREHKRIHEIVRAFNQLNRGEGDYRLVVGGDGPERNRLEELAGPNVEFVGYMDADEKRRRLAEAKAFVFAAENEDFGLVPIEAMASGTPVIGVKDGFTEHQIIDGKNGLLWAREGGHLRETIRAFENRGVEWSAERIEAFAERFDAAHFRQEMREAVATAVTETAVQAPWEREDAAQPAPETAAARVDGGEP